MPIEYEVKLLTFKARVDGEQRVKAREEWQTSVGNGEALLSLLERLGFVVVRYQEYRTPYRLDDVEIGLDETSIGWYLEIHRQLGGSGDMLFE